MWENRMLWYLTQQRSLKSPEVFLSIPAVEGEPLEIRS